MQTILRITTLFISALVFAGCASQATSIGMTPTSIQVSSHHNQSISLNINGGVSTNPLSQSTVSNEEFQKALEISIKNSGIFTSITNKEKSDLLLEVVIINLGQPMAGIDMSVTFTANWKLYKENPDTPLQPTIVWQDLISTNYTATPSDSLIGIKRLRIANEGAARENIKEGIRRLSIIKT